MRKRILILGLAGLVACATDGGIVDPAPRESTAVAFVQAGSSRLAKGLAGAMSQPGVRASVRDALRASLVTAHRVPLQEFLRTENGQTVHLAMASALAISPGELDALIQSLPALDLSMPRRTDRLSWRATPNVEVVGVVVKGGSNVAYRPDGSTASRATKGLAILALELPESKNTRVNPQPAGPGEVIQDANDGEIAGRISYTNANHFTTTVELASIATVVRVPRPDGTGTMEQLTLRNNLDRLLGVIPTDARRLIGDEDDCEQPYSRTGTPQSGRRDTAMYVCESGGGGGGGGGGPAGPPPKRVYMEKLVTHGICDGSIYWDYNCDNNEMRFTAVMHMSPGAPEYERVTLEIDGVEPIEYRANVNLPLTMRELTGAMFIDVDVWEADSGLFGGDDDFDPNPIIRASSFASDAHQNWYTAGADLPCATGVYANCAYEYNAVPGLYAPHTAVPWRQSNFTVNQR